MLIHYSLLRCQILGGEQFLTSTVTVKKLEAEKFENSVNAFKGLYMIDVSTKEYTDLQARDKTSKSNEWLYLDTWLNQDMKERHL